MAVNETIVTGRKWRRCIDVANKLWQRISYWTKASDVEFDDGQTAENKMGAISGITSDLNGESENVAASIKAVNQLNNNLNLQPEWITDDATGKITGYRFRGADTVFPFSNIFPSIMLIVTHTGVNTLANFMCLNNGTIEQVYISGNTSANTDLCLLDLLRVLRSPNGSDVRIVAMRDLKYTSCYYSSDASSGTLTAGATMPLYNVKGYGFWFTPN